MSVNLRQHQKRKETRTMLGTEHSLVFRLICKTHTEGLKLNLVYCNPSTTSPSPTAPLFFFTCSVELIKELQGVIVTLSHFLHTPPFPLHSLCLFLVFKQFSWRKRRNTLCVCLWVVFVLSGRTTTLCKLSQWLQLLDKVT